MKSYLFFISGRVQGVYYRANVAQNALEAGFSGYVKNLEDGRVEATVTCEVSELEVFQNILRRGSPSSEVTSIDIKEIDKYFSGTFEVQK